MPEAPPAVLHAVLVTFECAGGAHRVGQEIGSGRVPPTTALLCDDSHAPYSMDPEKNAVIKDARPLEMGGHCGVGTGGLQSPPGWICEFIRNVFSYFQLGFMCAGMVPSSRTFVT
jgi:hypothetical protein